MAIFGGRIALVLFTVASLSAQITGFTAESAEKQRALETQFDGLLDKSNLDAWMKRMSAKPHHAGSPASKEVADFIAEQFRAWGYETRIETYYPLFPTPKSRVVEMVAPTAYTARLEEPVVEGDATSRVRENNLPVYNAYSKAGDVTGELVYVNYGIPDLAGSNPRSKNTILLERAVRQAVLNFEPRILADSLRVSVRMEPEQIDRNAMLFIIEGKLWAQPLPLSLYLETELDLETGTVTVAETAR